MKTIPLPYGHKLSDSSGDSHYLVGPEKRTPQLYVYRRDDWWYLGHNSDDRVAGMIEVPFPSAESALAVGLQMCRDHDKRMAKYVVPKPLQDAIERAERSVREQERDLRSLNCRAAFGRWEVEELRKAAGMPPTDWDTDDLVKRLNEVSFDDKHPFFSEANLYDLLGKEDARTVLALIEEAKKRLDPIGGAL